MNIYCHLFTYSSSKKQGCAPFGRINPSPPAWSLPEEATAFLTNLDCPSSSAAPHSSVRLTTCVSLSASWSLIPHIFPSPIPFAWNAFPFLCLPDKLPSAFRWTRHCFLWKAWTLPSQHLPPDIVILGLLDYCLTWAVAS